MRAKNSEDAYGWVAILLHWLVAVTIIGLFALGFWMVDLSYYDPWYRQGPDIHRSVGILLFMAMVLRLVWRLLSPPPRPLRRRGWCRARRCAGSASSGAAASAWSTR